MRSGHIAWIGAVVTFVIVLGVGLRRTDSPVPGSSPAAVPQHDADHSHAPAAATVQPVEAAPAPGVAREDPLTIPRSEDPPEDGRAMMEAALASPDAEVRDDAAALAQALTAESADPAD